MGLSYKFKGLTTLAFSVGGFLSLHYRKSQKHKKLNGWIITCRFKGCNYEENIAVGYDAEETFGETIDRAIEYLREYQCDIKIIKKSLKPIKPLEKNYSNKLGYSIILDAWEKLARHLYELFEPAMAKQWLCERKNLAFLNETPMEFMQKRPRGVLIVVALLDIFDGSGDY